MGLGFDEEHRVTTRGERIPLRTTRRPELREGVLEGAQSEPLKRGLVTVFGVVILLEG